MALPPPTNPNTRPIDPIQLLDRSAREFLSRPLRRSTTPAPLSSSNSGYGQASSAVAAQRNMSNVLPPISSNRTDQQRYGKLLIQPCCHATDTGIAAEIGRSATVMPAGRSIYPGHMLPQPSKSNSPYAQADPNSRGYYHPSPQYPSSASPPSSPPYPSSRSPLSSGMPSPPPQSPVSSVSSRHSHSSSRSYHPSSPPPLPQQQQQRQHSSHHPQVSPTSGSLTDYAASGRLVPSRHSRRTSHDASRNSPALSSASSHHYSSSASSTSSHHYSSSNSSSSGYPGVGPAVANNLHPVLPRPPNTSGSASVGYTPRRSSTLGPGVGVVSGRSSSSRVSSGLRGIDDEDATNLVNTYHPAHRA